MKKIVIYTFLGMILLWKLSGCWTGAEVIWKEESPYLVEADRVVVALERFKAQYGFYPQNLENLDDAIWKQLRFNLRDPEKIWLSYHDLNNGSEFSLYIAGLIYGYNYDSKEWQKGWQQEEKSF